MGSSAISCARRAVGVGVDTAMPPCARGPAGCGTDSLPPAARGQACHPRRGGPAPGAPHQPHSRSGRRSAALPGPARPRGRRARAARSAWLRASVYGPGRSPAWISSAYRHFARTTAAAFALSPSAISARPPATSATRRSFSTRVIDVARAQKRSDHPVGAARRQTVVSRHGTHARWLPVDDRSRTSRDARDRQEHDRYLAAGATFLNGNPGSAAPAASGTVCGSIAASGFGSTGIRRASLAQREASAWGELARSQLIEAPSILKSGSLGARDRLLVRAQGSNDGHRFCSQAMRSRSLTSTNDPSRVGGLSGAPYASSRGLTAPTRWSSPLPRANFGRWTVH